MKTTRLSPTKRTGSAPNSAGPSRHVRAWIATLALLLCVTVVPAARAGNTIIYVNASATPGGNGASWAGAFRTIQEAFSAASIVAPQPAQIWVAEGRYVVSNSTTPFVFPTGGEVKMYGGFVAGNTSLNERDPDANPTFITGDIENNSSVLGFGVGDDAAEVMLVADAVSTSLIDGFRFNYARNRLMRIDSGSQLRVSNCVFEFVFPPPGVDAQGVLISGSFTAPKFVRNTVRFVIGGDVLVASGNGSDGNTGTNGANGAPGAAGGNGQNGAPGVSGSSGGFATGVLVTAGATPSIYANHVNSIRGGLGGGGGNGGKGGNGGTGGSGTAAGAAGGRGGNGGVGGTGGAGGPGGSATGIAYNTTSNSPVIAMNVVYDIRGGSGGFPGAGGQGGRGGNGGAGADSAGAGGTGGGAGNGGNGGIGGLGGSPGKVTFISTNVTDSSRTIVNNTISRYVLGTPGNAGTGGVLGFAGTPGAGGTGSPNGAAGASGSNGSAGASGDNGATPAASGIRASGTGSVSASNNIIDLPADSNANIFTAESTGPSVLLQHSLVTITAVTGPVTLGSRVIIDGPDFFDPLGLDGLIGTDDDDFSLRLPSPALDAGEGSLVPTDFLDDDGDGNTNEAAPFDIVGNPRFTDAPATADTGAGTAPIVDMGAFEADVAPPTIVVFEPNEPSYTSSPATFALLFDRPVSGVPFGLVSVNTTGDVNVTNLSIDRITDQFFTITAAFTSTTGGTLAAVVSDFDTITSQVGVPLNGVGSGNVTSTFATINAGGGGGNPPTLAQGFISGENTATPNSSKLFGFEFTEAVTGVDQSDFTLVTSGISGAFIESVFSLDGITWTVEIDTGNLSSAAPGTIVVRLTDNDSIQSIISGDPLDGPGVGNEYNSPVLTVANPADCNNNSVPDSLDIQNGTSQDCNNNGVPDECDIAGSFISGLVARAGPNERTSDHPPSDAVDGDNGTFTWSTQAFNTVAPSYLGVILPSPQFVQGLRLLKDRDGGGGPNIKDLVIQYTTDASPDIVSGTWVNVAGLTNGRGGTELLSAAAVNASGTVIGDVHDGVNQSEGFATLSFQPIQATALRVAFTSPGGGFNHYKVYEFQVLSGGSQDTNQNGIPDECEQGTLDANYTIDNSWRMNPFEPPAGWNTTLNFDDSDNAGWAQPVVISGSPDPLLGNGVWSSANGVPSTVFLRKKIHLLAAPQAGEALLNGAADDDVQVFINGQQVVFDQNCFAGPFNQVDVSGLLVPGENLIAVSAQDCGGAYSVFTSLQLPGSITDCNNNGVPDRSEIASIAVPDNNSNGVPDPCELTGPDSPRPWPFDLERAVNTPNFPQGAPQAFPLRAADLNDDGLTDFVTTGPNGPRLIIRGGPGELMFFNSDITASGPVFDTAVADFNLDGRPDLVCATGGGNALRVFRCTNFDGPSYSESGTGGTTTAQVVRLAVIDANSDGYPDLVGLQADGLVTLFTNTSTQNGAISMVGSPVISTALFANPNTTYAIDAADFDKDGRDDIVFVAGGLAVLRNAGNGTFNQIINDSTLHTAAAFVDLSGDERPLVVAGLASGGGEVIDPDDLARSLGTFTGAAPAVISPADIDGDGREDFGVVGIDGTLSWHRQEFLGQLNSRTIALEAGLFGGLVLADIDPDGDADFCVIRFEVPLARNANGPDSTEKASKAADASQTGAKDRSTLYTSRVNIIPNRRLHILADINGVAQIAATCDGPSAAAVADMDRDGRVDLITASFFDDTIAWHALDFEGPTFWSRTNIITSATSPRPDGPSAVATADFDGDGDIDVVACGILNGFIAWFENTGSGQTFIRRNIDATVPGASCLTVADFDLNGAPDVAVGNSSSGQLFIFRNFLRVSNEFVREVVANSGLTGVRSLAAGDIDNDGKPDLVAACFNLNRLRVFTQQDITAAAADAGPGGRGQSQLDFFEYDPITQSSPTCVTLADFNNDGNLDIASASSTENSIKVRLGNGSGSFLTTVTALSSMGGASWVHAVDLDADGLTDLAATGRQNNTFYRAKNLGNGTSWRPNDMFMQPEGPSVCVSGDFDGDGKIDLAVGSFNTDRFTTSVNYGEAISAFMTDTPSAIAEGEASRFATIFLSNDAKPGDPDVTYTNFIADFYTSGFQIGVTPVPLTSAQINALISRLEVFADADGDFAFGPSDPSIGFLNGPFTLDSSGRLSFTLPTPAAGRSVAPGDERYFFAVATTKPGASAAAQNRFGLYLTISDETFADTTFNEPVLPRYAGQYVSGTIQISPLFRAACPTDMDASGRTDTPDLVAFLARFGTTTLPYNNGDFSGDGRVGTPDLVKLLSRFGSACE